MKLNGLIMACIMDSVSDSPFSSVSVRVRVYVCLYCDAHDGNGRPGNRTDDG